MRRKAWYVLIVVACAAMVVGGGEAPAQGDVLLIRMPDEPPVTGPVTREAVEQFFRRWGKYLANSSGELLMPEAEQFARQVLGQERIFQELEVCERQLGVHVRVRFIPWMTAFRFLDQLTDDGPPEPVVVQLGDTWCAYFASKGVIVGQPRRHTWDVRFFWYDKRLMQPQDFADGDSFVRALRRVASGKARRTVAPFAFATAAEWDLLHTTATIFYMFSREPLLVQRRLWPLQPWKADFTSPSRRQAVDWLLRLRLERLLEVPDCTNVQLTEDFLDGKFACIVAPPWVAAWAKRRWGGGWGERIGVAWPPPMGVGRSGSFLGGSLLAIFAAPGTSPDRVADEIKVVGFLASRGSQSRYAVNFGFIPPDVDLLKTSYPELYPMAQRALREGVRYPECPLWPVAVENLIVRDHLYIFFRWLAAAETAAGRAGEEEERRELVHAALASAERAVNREFREHAGGRVIVVLAILLVGVAVGWVAWAVVERRRIQRLLQERVELAKLVRERERALGSTLERARVGASQGGESEDTKRRA